MIVQNVSHDGRTDISFTVPRDELAEALEADGRRSPTRSAPTGSRATTKIARVSLIGAGMKSHPGVSADMFEALADAGVNIEMISTSPIRTRASSARTRSRRPCAPSTTVSGCRTRSSCAPSTRSEEPVP